MIAWLASASTATGAKHNILYIMADDLNADWKNDRLAWMPSLKKYFSDEGTQFEVSGHWCARATLLDAL